MTFEERQRRQANRGLTRSAYDTAVRERTATVKDLVRRAEQIRAEKRAEERRAEEVARCPVRSMPDSERARWLARLSDRERTVIERRYGLSGAEPETLREVGDALGVSRARVGQIQAGALAQMASAVQSGKP